MTLDLRLGEWQTTMADVECDVMLTDAPYSSETHEGQRSNGFEDKPPRMALADAYEGIDRTYCDAFVASWLPRVRAWWVMFGDHISCRWWLDAFDAAGLYTFAPVPWIRLAGPRMSGDGPASGADHIAVARPRRAEFRQWGSLPGHYDYPVAHRSDEHQHVYLIGQKPEPLMRALVRDYSRPGWTIADPHAGSGTTLVAARAEGRHCIGSEMDPNTYAIAKRRIEQPYARDLFTREAV